MYCGKLNLKVASPQNISWNVVHLVYCGTLVYCGGATEGVDALQYKPFYTVPT